MMCRSLCNPLIRAGRSARGYVNATSWAMIRSMVRWFNGLRWFRRCQMCGGWGACHYRQRTEYVQEEVNWVNLCPPCKRVNDDHWDTMWSDYWGSRL